MIEIRSLRKRYGVGDVAREVLRGIDLSVAEGELVAVEGVSGCGKTTLLNLVGGLDRDYEGSIAVGGQDLDTLSDRGLAAFRNRTVGFVFQHFHLLDHLTCEENVSLPRFFQDGGSREEARKRAAEVLRRVGLGDRIDEFPSRLSGGQKQRVAIARALFNRPRLILCDEPTGNLDSSTGEQILELFRRLQEEDSITQIIVTHERRVSESAQRVIRMADGRIVTTEGTEGAA